MAWGVGGVDVQLHDRLGRAAERQNAGINAKARIKTKRAKRLTEAPVEVEMVAMDRSAQEIRA
jgi:hypothetical protein